MATLVKVLVTGGTGLAGAEVIRRLLGDGVEVHATRRDGPAREHDAIARVPTEADGVRWFTADVADPKAIADAAAGCDAVVHAARETDRNAGRERLGWVNVAGTENALNAARYAGCRRFIHVGSVDVTLANADRVNWNEDKALSHRPSAPHALTEFEAEELVIGLGGGDIETVVLRIATPWGVGDRRLLPRIIREVHAGGARLVGGGTNLVSTCHVRNLAEAVVGALTRDEAAGALYHVADDELTLARDFYGGLAETVGGQTKKGAPYPASYLLAPRTAKRGGSPRLTKTDVILRGRSTSFDVSPAREELGYEPVVHSVEGMAELREWVASAGAEAILAARRT